MEKKLGVYICTGCGIGEALDIEALEKKVPPKIKVRKTHPIMCSPEGVELIKQDIAEEGVNTAVIAACSRRVLYDVFDFGPQAVVQRVNLREGVVWSHKPQEEGEVDEFIQEMAEDYLRMGMAEAEKILPTEPAQMEEPIDKRIMVMGGGVTGLSAALEVAKAGYEAVVIEKEAQAGGFAAKMRKQTPWAHPYEDLQEPVIQQIIREAEAHPKVEIRTGTEVARIAGAPGLFDITFKPTGTKSVWDIPAPVEAAEGAEAPAQPPMADKATPENPANILAKDPEAERFGAVILATGWKPYELEAAEEAKEGEEGEEPGEGERPGERVRDPEEAARQQMGEDRWDEIVEEAEKAIEEGDIEKFEELQKEVQKAIEKAIEEGKAEPDEGEYGESGGESSESGEEEADDFMDERDEAEDFIEGGKAGGKPPEGPGERPPQKGSEQPSGAGEGEGAGPEDFEPEETEPEDFDVDPTKLDEWYKEKLGNDQKEVPMIDTNESNQAIDPEHGGDPKEAKETVEEFLKQLKKEAQEQGREEREDGDNSDEVYADDIDRAQTGNIESLSEFQKISGKVEKEQVEGTEQFAPVMEVGDSSPYIDMQFRRDMNERLKEWQIGKSVEYRKTSGRLNVPSYVRTQKKVPFRKMQRRSVKGQKYLFVIDMSGSISDQQENYKKALVNTFESLDGIGAKIAVFGFGGVSIMGQKVTGRFRVKAFEEGGWKPIHSGKMANIHASGGTPLGPTLEGLRKYIKKHRPTYVISVTDASPDDTPFTIRVIDTIRKENHRRVGMVAFGLTADDPRYKQAMAEDLKTLGYDRNFTSGKVKDIPEELVELIAPTK